MGNKIIRFIMMLVVVQVVFVGVFSCFEHNNKRVIVQYDNKMTAATDAGFVDENFYACVLAAAGQSEGTVLSDEQLAVIEKIECAEKEVTNIQGVEKLTGLKELNLNKNKISSVDLSKNVNLESVTLSANNLSSIDISSNVHLKDFYVSSNKLTSISFSNNTELVNMDISSNLISSVDLSKLSLLKAVALSNNKLSSIDVSNNPLLESLYISSNRLTSIDISNNSKLINFNLYDNKVSSINFSNNSNLVYVNLSNNRFSSLNVTNLSILGRLYASGNSFTSIDLTNNSKLTDLDLFQNKLSALNLSNNSNLKYLLVSSNQLKSLDLTANTLLERLYVSSNKIASLDLSRNTSLVDINVAFNSFDTLSLGNNTKVKRLIVSDSIIQNIDLSPLSSLEVLGTTDYLVVPVYGESFSTQDIFNYIPKNISLTKNETDAYQLYNTFDAVGGYYGEVVEEAGYDYKVDIPIQDEIITGKDGGTFSLQFVSSNIENSNITNYSGTKIFYGLYNLAFMRLTSDKYVIDDVNHIIDVSGDSDDEIKANLKSSLSGTVYEIAGSKLTLKYNDIVIKEFTLQRIQNPTTGSFLLYFTFFVLIASVGIIGVTRYKMIKNKV